MTVDPRAVTGFSGAADAYERGRPSYPPAAVAKVARELGVTRARTVLDLAAGTGKLTRRLLPLAGYVIAVDPSAAMLAELRARLPAADARRGSAEAIPAADASVDAVFVGQAFHWFRPLAACREIARVLSRGGGLAVIGNRARWTETDIPWLRTFDALVTPHRQAAGPFPAGDDRWKQALQETGLFAPLSSTEVEHVHRISAGAFVALVASWSWIANLPPAERDGVLARVRELVADGLDVTLRYRTEIDWTRSI